MTLLSRRSVACTPKQAVLTTLLLLAVLSWASFWVYTQLVMNTTKEAVEGQFQERAIYRFDTTLQQIDAQAERLERQLGALEQSVPVSMTPEEWARYADRLVDRLQVPGLVRAGFVDWTAANTPFQSPDPNLEAARTRPEMPEWWQALPETFLQQDGQAPGWWSPLYEEEQSEDTLVSLVWRIRQPNGELRGLLSLDLRLNDWLSQVARTAEAAPDMTLWLTDRQRRHVVLTQAQVGADPLQPLLDQAESLIPMSIFLTGFEHLKMTDNAMGTDLYYAPTRTGLRLTAALPEMARAAQTQAFKAENRGYLYGLGLVILLLTLAGLAYIVPALRNLRAFYLDKLTGLPNRPRLMQDLERDSSVTLVLLNLDRFREVNSLFGDGCGDLILKEVALRLESFMSSEDYAAGRLYRVGGDEFAILLPRCRPELIEQQLVALLAAVRSNPVQWQHHEIAVSATIGAAVPWFDTPREHSLYIHAREAFREARDKGLHYRVYDGSEPLEQTFEHNQRWAGKLRDALDEEGLVAWFQPILNNTTGRVDKYECLVRMLDNNGEVVSPGNFLEVAGKLRLEGHITRVMVETCFARFADSHMQFSINLSYTDLQQEELTDFIIERLDATGVGTRVIFELLESANIENYAQVHDFVNAVKARGCRIAIDDFGTGYSNFEHLLQLKVDFIKIDGSLIRNLDKDPNARRVARGIVGLARSMKIETVAEYVHSSAIQMEVLRLGISFSQGELIGMPAPELLTQVPRELTQMSYSGRSRVRRSGTLVGNEY
ncbi:EAL domain-containing protein [Marinobacterium sp. AK62]|uniref:EAL domain-containing protein n=1 Tax=Marinobacterium alkalitolerans TaxID=1542925 RepID=A0ABS3Z7B8_9GAMM|nr:EAL domain-containing protein [Marinobacterium alkalitolerans]MBP0047607.1 EAL domain-containing protein [Marinobacterium alkalitolerans]